MQKKYGPTEIKHLGDALCGEKQSREWLFKNGFKELAALCDAAIDENRSAANWLVENGHGTLVLFYNALDGEIGALNKMQMHDEKIWSAVVYATHFNQNAIEWLIQSDNVHYAKLADRIYRLKRKRTGAQYGDDSTFASWF